MRETIATMVDYRLVPGLLPTDAAEHGLLLLCVKANTAVIGVVGPMTLERMQTGRFGWFVDYINMEAGTSEVEFVELLDAEFDELLETSRKLRTAGPS